MFNILLIALYCTIWLYKLMSRIYFKAKYLSNCSIMDEGVKTGDSYAWQSILKARNVLDLGSTWGIGDGRKVKIRGVINGYQRVRSYPLRKACHSMPESVLLWMRKVHVGWRTGFLLNSYLTKQSLF